MFTIRYEASQPPLEILTLEWYFMDYNKAKLTDGRDLLASLVFNALNIGARDRVAVQVPLRWLRWFCLRRKFSRILV